MADLFVCDNGLFMNIHKYGFYHCSHLRKSPILYQGSEWDKPEALIVESIVVLLYYCKVSFGQNTLHRNPNTVMYCLWCWCNIYLEHILKTAVLFSRHCSASHFTSFLPSNLSADSLVTHITSGSL